MSVPSITPPLLAYLGGGAVAGAVAAIAMDVSMERQSEGWMPACIAVAALRGTSPTEVRFRDASLLHHGASVGAGLLYGMLAYGLAQVVPHAVWDGIPLLGHVLAAIAVTTFVYLSFAHVVLPRVGGKVYEERSTAVRGQWLRSTLTFAAVLTLAAPVLILLVAAALRAG